MSEWYSTSLQVTNSVIGMSKPDPGWPSPLYDMGYAVMWLEREVQGDSGVCRPDIILRSVPHKHVLVVESKCGSVQGGQHASYASLTEKNLRDKGVHVGGDPFTFEVAYATGATHQDTLRTGLETLGPMPMLVFSEEVAASSVAAFAQEELEALFAGGIDLTDCYPPMGYVPFDMDSGNNEILSALLSEALSRMKRGAPQATSEELTRGAMPLWESFAADYKRDLLRRIERLLSGCSNHFADFFDYIGSDAPHRLVFSKDLSHADAQTLHREMVAWDGCCSDCLGTPGPLGEQLSLYDLDEVTSEGA